MTQMISAKPLKILKASAGSGKTFALTVHFLTLLLEEPARYRSVLALTFTNKATAEMKSRIMEVLYELASGNFDQITDYLEAISVGFPDQDPQQLQLKADDAYRKILHDYSRFSVQTIDRFSQQVIRNFTYELGLDSSFKIEMNTKKVQGDLMRRLYDQLNDREELFEWIVKEMLRRIEADKVWNINRELQKLSSIIFNDHFRHLEDVAGREGNKRVFERIALATTTLQEDFLQGVQDRTHAIATHIKAAQVGAEDFYYPNRNYLLKIQESPKEWPDLEKLRQNLEKLKNPDEYQREKKRAAHITELYHQIDPLIHEFHAYLEEGLPTYYLTQAVDENIHYLRLLKDMADLLSDWRTENSAQLISDAQLLLAKIGQTEQGDPTFIWEKIGNKYQYFLFDEFQDTSHTQWENLKPLLINALSTSAQDKQAHLIVGDVKQSIYRWRNGDFRILLQGVEEDVMRAFHLTDAKTLIQKESLTFNFRSEENIIHFNNFLFTQAPVELQKKVNALIEGLGWEASWHQKRHHDAIIRAYEDVAQEVPPSKFGKKGGHVQLEFLGVKEGETGSLTSPQFQEIACARTFEQITSWLSENHYQASEIGILVRNNNEARLLVEYFTWRQSQGGLSFEVRSGDALQLGGHPAIQCLIATLRYMAFEGRSFNLYLGQLVHYYQKNKELEMPADAWLACGRGDIQLLSTYLPQELLTHWSELKKMPLGSMIEGMIECYAFDRDETALPYLLDFRDLSAGFLNRGAMGLQKFLEYWDEEGAEKTLSTGSVRPAVEITTIHKAKGLAYRTVMIPFCNWRLGGKYDNQVWFDMQGTYAQDLEQIPLRFGTATRQSSLSEQYFEEELYNYMDALNTLYVATTRAREHLWILAPDPVKIKKKGNGENVELVEVADYQVTTVGDLIHKTLKKHSMTYLFGAESSGGDTAQIAEKRIKEETLEEREKEIALYGYPSKGGAGSAGLPTMRLTREARELKQKSALFSTTLHDLMGKVTAIEQIEKFIAHYLLEGRLSPSEGQQVERFMSQAWAHPLLGTRLKSTWQQGNEQGIIDPAGGSRRPDKIFYAPEETLIVDFKLAPEVGSESHTKQVRQYTDDLFQLGFPRVRGFLYYFLQDELIEIK